MNIKACRCYIALGSNKGDRAGALLRALEEMESIERVEVIRLSPVYENAAHTIDAESQPDFLNAVAMIDSLMDPRALLAQLQEIERKAGRNMDTEKWAARELDLDILICEDVTLNTPELTLPHPRMAERRFVLQPLADLDPDLHVPSPFDAPVRELLARCPDENPLRLMPNILEDPNESV